MSETTNQTAHSFRAEMGQYSSVVGQSVHLIAPEGHFAGQVVIIGQDDRLRQKETQEAILLTVLAALNRDAAEARADQPARAGMDSLRDRIEAIPVRGKYFHLDESGAQVASTDKVLLLREVLAALLPTEAEAEPVVCERCQGNGEIVTCWDEYLHPPADAAADHATEECPDCDCIGRATPPAATTDNTALVEAEGRGMRAAAEICRAEQRRREKQMEVLQPRLGCMQRERFRVGAQPCGLLADAIEAALASREAPPAAQGDRE
ncbi:hypothetical protein [Paracoccus laeviglucosivorans]|uniref:Uncharacterized protein n=1 Tax=Paracoccus laeviglucosivorans TaxID=1197861 RepID=A0A521CWR8_9RHOB|nr:hypothetical protein [Paracoccus laeviglucosivorans]SMO63896.1 hypothetical protein SAMN06265221_105220 [Paracoccus laeviglucosivorans]